MPSLRMTWLRRCLWLGLLVLPLLTAAWLWHRRPAPRATAAMTQEAYVWQRAWDDGIRRAAETQAGEYARLLVLCAEVHWGKEGPRTDWPDVDWSAFRGKPVGVVLRAGPLPGKKLADRESRARLDCLRDGVRRMVKKAQTGGATVAEVQLDFDAATSQLDDYAGWLKALKADVAPLPLTVTTLPAWLGHSGFVAVVDATDGFVLQVHSLERPRDGQPVPPLCDAARAKEWIERAARLGRPFRVALPTCGYAVAFDPRGKYLGAYAEGPTPAWPAGARIEKAEANPAALAALVRQLQTDRPAAMTGLLWFRLPVPSDARNWRAETLRAVRRGEAPAAKPRVVAEPSASGAVDLFLANDGDGECPARLRLRVRGARVAAGDAVAGWTKTDDGQGGVAFTPPQRFKAQNLRPGDRLPVGWLRFDPADAKVETDVEPME